MFLSKYIWIQKNKLKYKQINFHRLQKIYSLCRNSPLKIMKFFVILGGYDKGFYGIVIFWSFLISFIFYYCSLVIWNLFTFLSYNWFLFHRFIFIFSLVYLSFYDKNHILSSISLHLSFLIMIQFILTFLY